MKNTGYKDSSGNQIYVGDHIVVIPRCAEHYCIVEEREHDLLPSSKFYLVESGRIFATLEYVTNHRVRSRVEQRKHAQKWNYKTRSYDPYLLPKECILYTLNLSQQTTCAQCGKELPMGNAFTSKEIHTTLGFGYPVCPICHQKEIEREKKEAHV